jgi:predicted TPR repeat methyltransferase
MIRIEENKMGWQSMYSSGSFRITTGEPSRIVKLGLDKRLMKFKKAADLGCGNGRNSLYAASLGYLVDAVDLVDLNFLENVDQKIMERIKFHNSGIMDFNICNGAYQSIIMTRIMQYLDDNDLKDLLLRCANGLEIYGKLILSYTASGGFSPEDKCIMKHSRSIGSIKLMLEKSGFKTIHLSQGAGTTLNTNISLSAETYDIMAEKPYPLPGSQL